ncbi:hypothetical protein [Halobacteriovorax sp. JY17]|uniref:hypothetical protein n=1 Tax=Halobacteriovorax sp. JY17 TaxID=2014617 RepID=UPI0025C15973|nr:hypothetical protein [Halobacteriovorax sp. JY17]
MSRLLSIFKQSKKSLNFLNRSEHAWFFESQQVAEVFSTLYLVTEKHKNVRQFLNQTIFTPSNGQYASAVKANVNLIIIYPELTYLMKSGKANQAIGILFHEIGHLILDHQGRGTSNELAQIEADLFSLELGYGEFLLSFLNEQRRSEQIEKRILALEKVLRIKYSSDSLQN